MMNKKKILLNTLPVLIVLVIFVVLQQLNLNAPSKPTGALPDFKVKVFAHGDKSQFITNEALSQKALFINFWATWCTSCASEEAFIYDIWNTYKDSKSINLLSVVTEDKLEELKKTKKRMDIKMPLVFDEENKLQQAFALTSIPTSILADSNGVICKRYEKALTPVEHQQIMEDLKKLESGASCKMINAEYLLAEKEKEKKDGHDMSAHAGHDMSMHANHKNNHAKKKQYKLSPDRPIYVPEFQLVNSHNKNFKRSDMQGKVWVANFIFTSCTAVCPILTKKMKKIERDFGKEKNLKFLSFSVDPKTDTPYVLNEYAKKNSINTERWTFLTGSWDKIQTLLTDGFKVTGAEKPVFHTDRFVLIDSELRIRGFYSVNTKHQMTKLKKDLLYLLNN